MAHGSLDGLGAALARSRSAGECQTTPLNRIASQDEADAIQSDAIAAYGGNQSGHVMEATSARVRRLLGAEAPIFGPLLDVDLLTGDQPFRLPRGVMGAGCGFAFILGRSYPDAGEEVSRASVERAVVSCLIGLQVLGRRVPGTIQLNALTASADFALNVAYRVGPRVEGWGSLDLAGAGLTARINGQVVAEGAGDLVMDHPLEAVAWLAKTLAARGSQIDAGEIVTTGSCVGVLQVLPGQNLEADAGPLGMVSLDFV